MRAAPPAARVRRASLVAIALLPVLAGCVGGDAPHAASPAALACPAPCARELASSTARLWEPHVAADPRDPAHLVAAVAVLRFEPSGSSFANDMLVAVSRDAGATWSATTLPHGPDAGPDHPLAGARALADPNVAFLPDGTTLVSGLGYNFGASPVGVAGQGFRIFVARSADGGASFPEIAVVEEDAGLATISPAGHRAILLEGPDAPTMAVAPSGVVHLSWRRMVQATPAEPERSIMVASRSEDGGRTWSAPTQIDTGGRNAVASQLVAAPDGTLYAAVGAWGTGGVTEAQETFQMLARSLDDGRSWETVVVDSESVPNVAWFPTLGLSSAGLHVAYAQADEEGRERVLVRNSTDRGASFGPAWPATEPGSVGAAMPTLAGNGGRAYLTWFSPHEAGNRLYARSFDADGATPPLLLDDSLREDATSLGEYFGIALAQERAFPVWTTGSDPSALRGAWIEAG